MTERIADRDEKTMIAIIWADEKLRRAFINYAMKNHVVINRREFVAAVDAVVNAGGGDLAILRGIAKVATKYPSTTANDEHRIKERADTVLELVKSERPVRRYLDYGCGDGTITQQLGQRLGLSATEIFGVDIRACSNPGITYIRGVDTRLAAGSIDLVTAFVSLHHITNGTDNNIDTNNDSTISGTTDINDNLDDVLGEIARVLSPGGTFIIREHNVTVPRMTTFLNLLHAYIVVRDYGDCDIDRLCAGISYRSAAEWDALLEKHGFKRKWIASYTGNNPQALYHASYTKVA